MPVTINGTTGITTPTYNGNTTAEYLVPVTAFKNRIINGAMVIDQRNAGASVAVNTFGRFAVDRFLLDCRPSTGSFNAQQVSDAPSGFVNSLRLTQTSVSAAASNDVYSVYQRIEGFNTADLNWGTANAQTVTVSFWVKSSVTGTYSVVIQNINATRRSYVTTYTVNAANTWEYKTVTIAGDTSGTWETTNSTGIMLWWDLGSGSDYQTSTLNGWQTANVFQANTATRWIGNSGATWAVTGVQLEKGSTATSFDYRPYGTEFALCQRYFQTIANGPGGSGSTTQFTFGTLFPVVMRTAPSASVTGPIRITDITTSAFTQSSGAINSNLVTAEGGTFHLPNFTGMTANRPGLLAQSSSGTIQLSAEL